MNSLPPTIDSLTARITVLEADSKDNHESHGAIYARLEKLETGHAVLDSNLANIWAVLREIQADVKDMKAKPGKRWDLIVSESIKWLALAALGAMFVAK